MPGQSLAHIVARFGDRILAPREATRNAAAAAFEIGLRTAAWRHALGAPYVPTPPTLPVPAPRGDQVPVPPSSVP